MKQKQATLDAFFAKRNSAPRPATVAAAAAAPPPPVQAGMMTVPCALKGRKHHPLGSASLVPYSVLVEVENLADQNALAVVDAAAAKLGYIDKATAALVSPLLRAGLVRVASVQPDAEYVTDGASLALVLALRVSVRGQSVFDGSFKRAAATAPPNGGGFVKASQVPIACDADVTAMADLKRAAAERTADSRAYFAAHCKAPKPPAVPPPSSLAATMRIAAHLVPVSRSAVGAFDFAALPAAVIERICTHYGLSSAEVLLGIALASKLACRALARVRWWFEQRRAFCTGDASVPVGDAALALRAQLAAAPSHAERRAVLAEVLRRPMSFCAQEEIVFGALRGASEAVRDDAVQLHCNHRARASVGLTSEQLAVAHFDCAPGSLLKVHAFAGAGKTRSLLELARRRPDLQMLYLCFNKSVQKHAEKTFPANVTCRTLHALAHSRGDVQTVVTSADQAAVAALLHCASGEAARACAALNDFLTSSSETPADSAAATVWAAMQQGRLAMTLQGMLKRFALQRPALREYAVVLLDEAQDSNACALDVVRAQAGHAAVVMVGDSYQAIYGWNAAKNALAAAASAASDVVAVPHGAQSERWLTRSFRFGPLIGGLASRLVRCHPAGGQVRAVLGCARQVAGERVGRARADESLAGFVRRAGAPVLVACRTNAGVARALVDALAAGLTAACLGDSAATRLRRLKRAAEERVANGALDAATTEDVVGNDDDDDDSAAARWAASDSEALTRLAGLSTKAVGLSEHPDVVLSSVHACKGLEYDGVWLEDDFPIVRHAASPLWGWLGVASDGETAAGSDGDNSNGEARDWPEELRLLYVAVTRAKRAVVLCASLEAHRAAMKLLVPGMAWS